MLEKNNLTLMYVVIFINRNSHKAIFFFTNIFFIRFFIWI